MYTSLELSFELVSPVKDLVSGQIFMGRASRLRPILIMFISHQQVLIVPSPYSGVRTRQTARPERTPYAIMPVLGGHTHANNAESKSNQSD